MIHIAIVDDEASVRQHLRECIDYLALKENEEFHITEFATGAELLCNYQPIYDIILMDIDMPGLNGMDVAADLRRVDSSFLLVFVTNLAQYAIRGYEVDALNYLLKPINKYEFAMKMSRVLGRIPKRDTEFITIRSEGENVRVMCSEIRYLDVMGHYVNYHTTRGDFVEYSTMKDAETKIDKSFFVKCNRCYLVNLKHVSMVKDNMVVLKDTELPISRPQKKAFLGAFANYLGGIN